MSAQTPTLREIGTVVSGALGPEIDADQIADFLASVDWGRVEIGSPEARLLGELEGWTTSLGEGDLSEGQYRERLRSAVTRVAEANGGPRRRRPTSKRGSRAG